jgi:hypothetical protein
VLVAGSHSFWEGWTSAGDALSLVVTDSRYLMIRWVLAARIDAISPGRGNAFMHHQGALCRHQAQQELALDSR